MPNLAPPAPQDRDPSSPRLALSAVLLWSAMLAVPAFVPRAACDRRLSAYVLAGAVALLVSLGAPWLVARARSGRWRFGTALLLAGGTVAVWCGGFALADVQLLCRLF